MIISQSVKDWQTVVQENGVGTPQKHRATLI